MSSDQVTEGSAAFFSVDLEGTDGNPDVPLQAFVTLFCVSTRTVLRMETQLSSVDSTIQLESTADENRLIRRSNNSEVKRWFLRNVYGSGDEFTTSFDYTVNKAKPV